MSRSLGQRQNDLLAISMLFPHWSSNMHQGSDARCRISFRHPIKSSIYHSWYMSDACQHGHRKLRLVEDFEMLCLALDLETLRLTRDFKTLRMTPARCNFFKSGVRRKILKCCNWHLILKHCAWRMISKHCIWRLPDARQTPARRPPDASQTQLFEIRRQAPARRQPDAMFQNQASDARFQNIASDARQPDAKLDWIST